MAVFLYPSLPSLFTSLSAKLPTTTYEVREILLDSKLDPESFGEALTSLEKSGYISIEYGSNTISKLNINECFPK